MNADLIYLRVILIWLNRQVIHLELTSVVLNMHELLVVFVK